MDVVKRHSQILADRAVEILELRICKTGLISRGCDIAVVVSPLVHGEYIDVAAVDVVEVDDLRNRAVDDGTGIREDHYDFLVEYIGALNASNHIADPYSAGVINDVNTEVGIGMTCHLLTGDVTASLEHLFVFVRNEIRRLEFEHDCISLKNFFFVRISASARQEFLCRRRTGHIFLGCEDRCTECSRFGSAQCDHLS